MSENVPRDTPAEWALLAHEFTHVLQPPPGAPNAGGAADEIQALANELRAWKTTMGEQTSGVALGVTTRVPPTAETGPIPSAPPVAATNVFRAADANRSLPVEQPEHPTRAITTDELMRRLTDRLRIEHERGA